jgi:hypothetical protein
MRKNPIQEVGHPVDVGLQLSTIQQTGQRMEGVIP